MLELTSLQALEIGSERRREIAADDMRAARATSTRVREVAGAAIVALGKRIAGDRHEWIRARPAQVKISAGGDCA